MAKLTGQFTTPSLDSQNNKIHKPFQHGVVFVFTGVTKVTRETDAKGKYSFDLANGEYEVSVYLKGNTEKDRFDMRAGEKFVVTSTTKEDALEKWLQVIGTGGKDELSVYYEKLLAQMEKVRDQFRDETSFVGNTNGKIMREGAYGVGVFGAPKFPSKHDFNEKLKNGFYALPAGLINAPDWQLSGDCAIANGWGTTNWSILVMGKELGLKTASFGNIGPWKTFYNDHNTTVDSNGFIKSASPIVRLFDDRIETNDQFKEEPVFEKIGVGTYKISNTLGLAREGWTYEKPRGKDGNPYFRIIVKKTDDGCIISVHDEFEALEEATITDIDGNERKINKVVKILGEARDIKDHERWIDLRFHEEPEEYKEPEEVEDIEEESDLEKHLKKWNAVLL